MTPADGLPEEPKYWRYTTEGMDYAKPNSLQKWVTKQDYDALRAAYDAERRAGQELRERLDRANDVLAGKHPTSFGRFKWACGHEGEAACVQCFREIRVARQVAIKRAEAAEEQVYDARTNIEARVGKEAAGYMIACRLSSMEAHEWTARLEGDLQKLIEDAGVLCAAAGAKMFLPDEFSRCASAIETAKQTLHALAAAKGEE